MLTLISSRPLVAASSSNLKPIMPCSAIFQSFFSESKIASNSSRPYSLVLGRIKSYTANASSYSGTCFAKLASNSDMFFVIDSSLAIVSSGLLLISPIV